MTALEVEVDPGEAGFDAERLGRLGTHLNKYVDLSLIHI